MRIRFKRTLNDIIAFSDFHYSHSPAMKKIVARYRVAGALAILLFPAALIHWIMPEVPLPLAISVSVAGAVIFAVQASNIVKRKLRDNTRKLYSEGKSASLEKEVEMELTETGLIARSDIMETKFAWGAIERIESTADYTFFYISPIQAYIVPHNKIIEGNFPAMLAEIGRLYQPGQRLQRTIA